MKFSVAAIALALSALGGNAFAQTNVAPLGTATQSSTAFDGAGYNGSGPASRAIDGNIDGAYWDGSVTHTNFELGWWSVSLPALYSVSSINLFNRTDCCSERINGFSVSLYNGNVQTWSSGDIGTFAPTITGANVSGMSFDLGGAIGDRVVVSKTIANYLHIAEVQVMATPVPEPESYAMLLAGLGLMAGIARRKQN